MRRIFALAVCVLVLTAQTHAAGTVAVRTSALSSDAGEATRYILTWTSDASGDVNGTPVTIGPGRVLQATIVPGTGGAQPSDLFDVTLVDANGVDLLEGLGANRSNAASTIITALSVIAESRSTVELRVAAAGSVKSGAFTFVVSRGVP